jgi:hypothetical protein
MKLREELKTADQKGRITFGRSFAGRRFALRQEEDGTAILTPVQIVPENEQPLTSRRLDASLASLEVLQDNWDGRGSLHPSMELIASAREVLALVHAGATARRLRWTEPHIGSNERGQITLEWWQGDRALSLFVRSPDRVDYLKSWGADIDGQMEDGEVVRMADFAALSRWLYEEPNPSR